MARKTKQENSNIENSKINQINVDTLIVNGITEEKCRQICLDVYKNNIMEFQKEAQDKAFLRASELTDIFIEKLSKQDDEIKKKIEESLTEPAMQEAIFKSQKCYAMSNEQSHLDILTNLILERGKITEATNRQMLIDDAIDIMPRLSKKHLDILLMYTFFHLSFSLINEDIFNNDMKNFVILLNCIFPLDNFDDYLSYLELKNCLVKNIIRRSDNLENIIARKYVILKNGFSKEDMNRELNLSQIDTIIQPSLIVPENYIFKATEEYLQPLLDSLSLSAEQTQKVYEFQQKYSASDSRKIKEYLLEKYPDLNILYEKWNNVSSYDLSTLGALITLIYYKHKYKQSFNWDFK